MWRLTTCACSFLLLCFRLPRGRVSWLTHFNFSDSLQTTGKCATLQWTSMDRIDWPWSMKHVIWGVDLDDLYLLNNAEDIFYLLVWWHLQWSRVLVWRYEEPCVVRWTGQGCSWCWGTAWTPPREKGILMGASGALSSTAQGPGSSLLCLIDLAYEDNGSSIHFESRLCFYRAGNHEVTSRKWSISGHFFVSLSVRRVIQLSAVTSFLQGEIDAREDIFKSTNQFGQSLVAAQHYANDEIKEKVGETETRGNAWYFVVLIEHIHWIYLCNFFLMKWLKFLWTIGQRVSMSFLQYLLNGTYCSSSAVGVTEWRTAVSSGAVGPASEGV